MGRGRVGVVLPAKAPADALVAAGAPAAEISTQPSRRRPGCELAPGRQLAEAAGEAAARATSETPPLRSTAATLAPAQRRPQSMSAIKIFKDSEYQFGLDIALGSAYRRGADVGECLATAGRIRNGKAESWFSEWTATARRAEQAAESSRAAGHAISAREGFLRAAIYYSIANYQVFASDDPARGLPTWQASQRCWEAFAELVEGSEAVRIPYEETTLPGWLFAPAGAGEPGPTVIMNNGSDGPTAAMWTMGAGGALERGYRVLVFDGPGQNAVLHEQKLYFRPDWEAVIGPVVDFLAARPEVEHDRIAIIGVSQAGYWVPRAVAFEPRLAAAVADPGVLDVGTSWREPLPRTMTKMLEEGDRERFEKWMQRSERFSRSMRATLAFRMAPYGIDSYYDVYKELERYRLEPDVLAQIRCPMLITDPDSEAFWPGQSRQLYDALPGPKQLVRFTAEEGAESHCEPLGSGLREQRIFDWLDEILLVGG